MRTTWAVAVVVALGGCSKPAAEAPKLKAPEPLPRIVPAAAPASDGGDDEREALFRVQPFSPSGGTLPDKAGRVVLEGASATLGGAKFALDAEVPKLVAALAGAPVLLEVRGETWVVHAAALLAALDDAGAETWFKHPDAELAYRVTLRDAVAFQAWLEEPAPGKVRVIHRADGFEVTTNMGKLMGGDPNGPSVPVRGGKMDLPTLQRGLASVRGRFKTAPDLCFMPSYGTSIADAVRALAANWQGEAGPTFGELCVVYPRPGQDAGR